MSEFKVGDWVKRTDKITESIYQISSIDKDLIKCNFIKNGENWRLHTTKGEIEYATPEEIAAGHRIDKPSNPRELETLDKPENHISPNCKVGMFEMDKCREDFQKAFPIPAHWIEFDEKTNRYYCPYVADATASAYQSQWVVWQHQQAKVEELKASHHGEVIGHEVHFKKIKQERDELQTLYIQQGINMLKLQKRVDAVIIEIENMYLSGAIGFDTVKKLEQALKGEG
ncbi:TPA: hypothetical protein ACJKZR_001384 [Acinetobacter baumannii]|nr:hypothetical protein [Acinetobacter baumannii]MCM1587080.1 hypothetical protein [Acinetobacter baumannii]UTH20233.1 hypothetical protein LRX85_05555 [Acinetobacter baumannii]UTH23853.1 hypothetical protein LRX86_06070 [Acinetobacter baumannii]